MSNQMVIGIGDMKFVRNQGILITYALGSCVGIALYDPVIRLAALIHIMLPEAQGTTADQIYKFADSGIYATIKKMEVFGARRDRMTAKIAGGARMFDVPTGSSVGNIGARNADSVKKILRAERIRLVKEDTGANYARTMLLDAATGEVKIRSFGKAEITM